MNKSFARFVFLVFLPFVLCGCIDGSAKYHTDRVVCKLEKYATDQSLNSLHAKILDQKEYNDSLCVTHLTMQTESGLADMSWVNVEVIVAILSDGRKKAYIGKPVVRQWGMETINNPNYGHLFSIENAMKGAAEKAVVMLGKEI